VSLKTLRNIAIIALIALLVTVAPGGGNLARGVLAAISMAFLFAIGSFGWRLYKENQLTLWSMTNRHRAALYGSFAVCFMALVATARLWNSGVGILIWFGLVIGSAFTAYTVIKESRRYAI